jgi:hypothetical protein
MSISSVNGIGRTPAGGTDSSPSQSTSPLAGVKRPATVDELGQPPKPPRFPWLSRLSQQLEPASKEPVPFASAPVLGDNIDKAA